MYTHMLEVLLRKTIFILTHVRLMKHAKTYNRGLFSRSGLAHYNDVLKFSLEGFPVQHFMWKSLFNMKDFGHTNNLLYLSCLQLSLIQ